VSQKKGKANASDWKQKKTRVKEALPSEPCGKERQCTREDIQKTGGGGGKNCGGRNGGRYLNGVIGKTGIFKREEKKGKKRDPKYRKKRLGLGPEGRGKKGKKERV